MITASRLKFLTTALAALGLAGCSSSYGDYDDYGYDDSYGYSSQSYGGNSYDAYGYGNTGPNAGCIPAIYGGGYAGSFTQGGLRTGRYANPVVATGNVEFYGKKSRYGSAQSSASGAASSCMTGGYWAIPTYQVITQAPQAVTTVPEPVITTTIMDSCPDRQYRMDNGDCAIMITEETEQYVPPVAQSYPPVSTVTEEWYNPIRK